MVDIKITNAVKTSSEDLAKLMNPLVREWFFSKFENFSETQLYGVKYIHNRRNILISAPTGGTKTLSSFMSILNYIITLAEKNELENKVYAVYTSPLKSLSNDIKENLIRPLNEIYQLAETKGIQLQEIRIGSRTGDTTPTERQKMLVKTPHILITTPESLAIVLTTEKLIEKFKAVEFIIIDEIHAMANKRGVHLSLTIERLQEMSMITPTRIGLSATIFPLEEVARFLAGSEDKCVIADVQFLKKTDIEVLTPTDNLIEDLLYSHSKMYKLLDELIDTHKSTIVFTNTRSATERVVHHLKEIFPQKYIDNIGAHHSSLSKENRFEIEQKLREGKLKVVVTSTSLEMGIDVGFVDLVIMLGSPKSVSRSMQRAGRSGHKLYDTAKGRFVVLDRDDLIECSVIAEAIREKKIDRIYIPKNCLDVLSQHIFAMTINKQWDIEEMFNLIRKSYCYENLTRKEFMSVIGYLSGDYALEYRNVYAKIWYDPQTKLIGKKGKLARVISITNMGTIPDESHATVTISSGPNKDKPIGKIDEIFVEKLKKGDVFVLGGEKYTYIHSRGMKVYVVPTAYKQPTIPMWFSEMLPLSFDLAVAIQKFRGKIKKKFEEKEPEYRIKDYILEQLHCSTNTAEQIYNYFNEQYHFSEIPDDKTLVIEHYIKGKHHVIFHTLYGRRVNDAMSRALAYLVGKQRKKDVEVGISDNGFYLAGEVMNIDKALKTLIAGDVEEILKEAIEKSQVLKRRFRHCATRSLMILRNYKGVSKSVGKQQVGSEMLFRAVKAIDDNFCILNEARREVMEDLMDIENMKNIIEQIKDRKIEIKNKTTHAPSPFALGLIMQGYSDLIRVEDRAEFLKRIHDIHKKSLE